MGKRFRIKYISNLEEDGHELDGRAWVDDNCIEINAELIDNPAHLRRTLMHECLHVIMSMSGQKEGLKLDEGQEEGLVAALEHGLFPIVKHFTK